MGALVPPHGAVSDSARLHAAAREARNDAAPFAVVAAAILIALALVAKHAGWEYLGRSLWWMWLVVAAPYVCLAATLLLGLNRLVRHDHRREIVIGLLAIVWVFNVLGVVVLVASLIAHSATRITGSQLLASGGAVWFTNTIAFGLAFWELDCGGPVARALATDPRRPDFQFPQDENPQLAQAGWAPRLWDYFYISLTNATAFSPTDSMPLTRTAKALMAAESMLSVVTVLLVAARAVNILVQSSRSEVLEHWARRACQASGGRQALACVAGGLGGKEPSMYLAQAQTVLARVLEIGLEGRIDADAHTRDELDAKVTVWLSSETAPEQFAQLAQLCVDEKAYALVGFEGYAELR